MLPRFRQILLENYKFAEDVNTFNRLNRALKNVITLSPLSLMEVRKYKMLETVAKFTTSKSFVEVLGKLKLARFVVGKIGMEVEVEEGREFSKSAFT